MLGFYKAFLCPSDKNGKFTYFIETKAGGYSEGEDYNNFFDASRNLIDKFLEMYSEDKEYFKKSS